MQPIEVEGPAAERRSPSSSSGRHLLSSSPQPSGPKTTAKKRRLSRSPSPTRLKQQRSQNTTAAATTAALHAATAAENHGNRLDLIQQQPQPQQQQPHLHPQFAAAAAAQHLIRTAGNPNGIIISPNSASACTSQSAAAVTPAATPSSVHTVEGPTSAAANSAAAIMESGSNLSQSLDSVNTVPGEEEVSPSDDDFSWFMRFRVRKLRQQSLQRCVAAGEEEEEGVFFRESPKESAASAACHRQASCLLMAFLFLHAQKKLDCRAIIMLTI